MSDCIKVGCIEKVNGGDINVGSNIENVFGHGSSESGN